MMTVKISMMITKKSSESKDQIEMEAVKIKKKKNEREDTRKPNVRDIRICDNSDNENYS